jgi:class 3 adenylate cyclase
LNDVSLDQRRLVLMFTDVTDSSALKTKLGNLAYFEKVLVPHDAMFRKVLADFPGAQEIKNTGDGFFVKFQHISGAVNAALQIQHEMRSYPWEKYAPRTRIGIHVGDGVVVIKGSAPGKIDIQGHAVDMCFRVTSLGIGGQILLTRDAYDGGRQFVREHPQATERGKSLELQWLFHGRYHFKGKDADALEVFEVGASGFAPFTKPQNPEFSARSLEIAYVLFMDIVSYSLLPIDHQSDVIQQLQRIVRQREEFEKAQAANQVIYLPTGDGMALAFFNDPCAPVRCARGISRVLKQGVTFQLRMGIHFGPIYRHDDINSTANVAGGGINIAQRIMDCGDGGHVLVSKAVAEVLLQLSEWNSMVHHLGEHEVKHGLRIEIFNIFDREFGNQETPSKLRVSTAKPVKERALDVALGREISVFVPTELVALVRLAQSEGLKGVLESDPDYSVTPNDVRSKPLVLEFPVDPKGHPAPLNVTLRIASPDFDPKSQCKIIRVPPLADSETCIFLLTPTQLGELRVNVELYCGDVTLISRVLKTHANTSDRMPPEVSKAIVTIPLIVVVRPSDLAFAGQEDFSKVMAKSVGSGVSFPSAQEGGPLDSHSPIETQPRPTTSVVKSNDEITREFPAYKSAPARSRKNLTIAIVVIAAAIVIPLSFISQSRIYRPASAPVQKPSIGVPDAPTPSYPPHLTVPNLAKSKVQAKPPQVLAFAIEAEENGARLSSVQPPRKEPNVIVVPKGRDYTARLRMPRTVELYHDFELTLDGTQSRVVAKGLVKGSSADGSSEPYVDLKPRYLNIGRYILRLYGPDGVAEYHFRVTDVQLQDGPGIR